MNVTSKNKFRIPIWMLAALDGILIALVAIFIYKVNPSLVLGYGLIAVMFLSHIFMHSGHGNHGAHQEHDNQANLQNSPGEFSPVPDKNNDANKHSHGCH